MWASIIPALVKGGIGLFGAAQAGASNRQTSRDAYGQAAYQAQVNDYAAGLGDQAANWIVDANNTATGITTAGNTGYADTMIAADRAATDSGIAAVNEYISKMYGGLEGLLDLNTNVYETNLATINEGAENVQGRLDSISAESAPGYQFLKQTVADPYSLTDLQNYELDNLRDSTQDHIRTSSLAGSGRAASALIKDVEADYTLRAQDANRRAALGAAGILAGDYSNAQRAGADLEQGKTNATLAATSAYGQNAGTYMDSYGRDIAGAELTKGGLQSDSTMRIGGYSGDAIRANAGASADALRNNATAKAGALDNRGRLAGVTAGAYGTATNTAADARAASSKVYGQTLGDIGSTITNSVRESRYGDRLKKLEKQASRYS